jgi:hypothetical protein
MQRIHDNLQNSWHLIAIAAQAAWSLWPLDKCVMKKLTISLHFASQSYQTSRHAACIFPKPTEVFDEASFSCPCITPAKAPAEIRLIAPAIKQRYNLDERWVLELRILYASLCTMI